MNYGRIYDCDVANGPGMRVSLFVSGCTHHCPGCFNEETWNFEFGTPYTQAVQDEILKRMDRPYIQGLTILGGEPMEPENQQAVYDTVRAVREKFGSQKNIWIYSGYTLEQLTGEQPSRAATPLAKEILDCTDILVDGEFIMAEKDVTLQFRGSRNQRIIPLHE